jgi:hypothetical protein
MQIDFDELPVTLAGVNAFCLAGNFEIDVDGEISGLWVEEWGTRYVVKPRLIAIHSAKDGLAKLFWHVLRPLLRQRYAEQIAHHCRTYVARDSVLTAQYERSLGGV